MACASTRMPCRHRVLVLNDAAHGRARGSGENHGEHHDLDGVNVHSAPPSGLVRLDGGVIHHICADQGEPMAVVEPVSLPDFEDGL